MKRIYRYFFGIKDFGFIYKLIGTGKFSLVGWSDADWVVNSDSRQSIVLYVFMVAGAAVSWSVKFFFTVCLSLTESEYGFFIRVGKEVIVVRFTLSDLYQV